MSIQISHKSTSSVTITLRRSDILEHTVIYCNFIHDSASEIISK